MKITFGDGVSGLLSGVVPGEAQLSGEAAPRFSRSSAATTYDPKEVVMKTNVREKKVASMRSALCLLLFCGAATWLFAGDGSLSVGTPTRNGAVDVNVKFPGVVPYGSSDGTVTVHVSGIKSQNNDPNDHRSVAQIKADKIAAQINHDFNTDVATVQQTAGGWQVNLSYNKNGTNIAGHGWIPLNGDKTGEGAALAYVDIPQPGYGITAYMGFDTGLSGFDGTGSPSTFTATFGYTGFTDTASVSYNQLTNNTLDGLVTQLYTDLHGGLPTSLQSNLHLDLPDDLITFSFPTGHTGYFGGTISIDTLAEPNGGLVPTTPEPSSLFLFGSGILGLSGFFRKRLLAPS